MNASKNIILRKSEEARLNALFNAKCDEQKQMNLMMFLLFAIERNMFSNKIGFQVFHRLFKEVADASVLLFRETLIFRNFIISLLLQLKQFFQMPIIPLLKYFQASLLILEIRKIILFFQEEYQKLTKTLLKFSVIAHW